ncbi:MAG: hypothetical protein GX555_09225 [Actinomycetales bacterium]|nr:hypothetical protein [Actinomycetales bacterium]
MGAGRHSTDPARHQADRALEGARRRIETTAPRDTSSRLPTGGAVLLALQRRAGNAAVSALLTGFGPGSVAATKAPPAKKDVSKVSPPGKVAAKGGLGGQAAGGAGPGMRPEQDPAFAAVTSGLSSAAAMARAHGPAAAKAAEARGAAQPPTGDLAAQAEAAKVDEMDAQQPGAFDKKAFISAVKAAIEAKAPTTLEEADEYRESGKAGEVKGDVAGLVTQGKGEQTKDIATATEAPPDHSKAVAKEVVPMGAEPVGQVPAVPAAGAVPKPAQAERTNLQAGKRQADAELARAEVTEEQLARSNEPEFQQAVADKREAAQHADTAPGEFRQQEQQVIEQDRAGATAGVTEAVAGMQGTRAAAVAGLVADKAATKEEDEGKRDVVATKVDAIYVAAEQDVKAILDGIDPKVEKAFGEGEAAARASFESYVGAKMSAYKRDRYGGMLGGLKWAKDKLLGTPAKVDEFYQAGRELYLKKMDGVTSRVADIVGGDLTRAKKRIAAGRAEITAYVKNLSPDLRKTGAKAAQAIGDRFAALEGEVAAKQEATVDLLASKYVESRQALDARIEELQAANRGLVDKAIGAIKGVIGTIRQLAAMLENVLARVSGVVGKIIKDPIGFLGNLIAGVKGGILKFRDNILDHLRKGLMGWLFGALAEGGVELPESFDLKGIVTLLASLFGLTWRSIRTRILKRIGARALGVVERGVELFQVLAGQGVGGLWEMLLEKLGNIKDMILEQVQDFVVTRIIKAGILWLIGLLNPAAAFIKACKMIYDIVMFFVTNAARIGRFVNTVIDSVADIVRGNVGGVVDKINNVLGQMVPLVIGFLASAIGLGGIGKKIREIVTTLQKPFIRAVDFVIGKGLKLAGPLIRGLKGLGSGARARFTAGKQWAGRKAAAVVSFLTFRTRFDAAGEQHTLYTAPGSDRLMVASTPTELSRHPDAAVRAAYQVYRRAVDAATTAPAKKRAATAPLAKILTALRAWFAKQGAGHKDPQASAPGIGNIAPYRNQPSSLRTDIAVWALEREHVIPRGFSNALFRALNIEGIPAGKTDYRAQTTIMIYKGAANQKTHGPDADNAMTSELKGNLADLIAEYHKTKPSQRGLVAGLIIDSMMRLLGAYADDAVERTWIAVEHDKRRDGIRRGPPGKAEAAVPARSRIHEAASKQLLDIERQLKSRLR